MATAGTAPRARRDGPSGAAGTAPRRGYRAAMSRRDANLLRLFAGWTLFVWIVQQRNIWSSDNSMGFKLVHTVLAIVSIALALVCLWVVTRYRGRNARRDGRDASARG